MNSLASSYGKYPPPAQTSKYRGRFAPSPSGQLHYGSLIAAVASYLDAKHNNGSWLVRIEDVDTTRIQQGADKAILSLLEQYGLYWDETVIYQSQRSDYYQSILSTLATNVYQCSCTRKQLMANKTLSKGQSGLIYPGFCRNSPLEQKERYSYRLKTNDKPIRFLDRIQNQVFTQSLLSEVGDFILKRTDGLFAYQLAVVADDAAQQITHIVRGSDLLDNTPRQWYLQELLGYPHPSYAHFPIVAYADGMKFSKQTRAEPISADKPIQTAIQALQFLGQQPPPSDDFESIEALWQWAIPNWSIALVPKKMAIKLAIKRFE